MLGHEVARAPCRDFPEGSTHLCLYPSLTALGRKLNPKPLGFRLKDLTHGAFRAWRSTGAINAAKSFASTPLLNGLQVASAAEQRCYLLCGLLTFDVALRRSTRCHTIAYANIRMSDDPRCTYFYMATEPLFILKWPMKRHMELKP